MFFNRKSSIFKLLNNYIGFSLFKSFIPITGSILFVIYVGYLAWTSLGPEKPVPDQRRQSAALAVARNMTEEIRLHRGDIRATVLLHFANDPSDFFTNSLRDRLDSTGVLNLEDRTLMEKIRNKLNLRNYGCNSTKEALESVSSKNVQGILWGTLEQYESTKSGVILKGSWQLLDCKSKTVVYDGTFNYDTTSKTSESLAKSIDKTKEMLDRELSVFSSAASSIPWFVRFLGFVLTVLLLPIITISFIRTMVAKRSNKVNAFMLITYTVIGMILAFLMIGGMFYSFWSVLGFLIASGCAFMYNHYIMCYALKLES